MVDYNPFSDEVVKGDPLPIYKQLRDEAPAYYLAQYDTWALSRFEDIWKASADMKNLTAAKGTTSAHLLTKVQPVTPMINNMDAPDHTRLRAAFRKPFAAPEVAKLEPMIRRIASERLDAARDAGGLDVIHEMTAHVAVTVACTISGLPAEDGPFLNDLVWRFFKREEGHDGATEAGLEAMAEMFAYFHTKIAERRAGAPKDDVLQILLEFEQDGAKLDDDALASHLAMLIIGGSETFPKTFASIVRRLWEHPDQRQMCVDDPALIPDAYNEGLRYDMPTQFLMRQVKRPVELAGAKMTEGQNIMFLYHSGNHDEREFPDPDRFDILRRPPRILSFGYGPHSCLGVNTARLEGRVCLEELLRRAPRYEVELDQAERLLTEFVQGYWKLPIRLSA
ncbi:MAG: cytochrome P450 [Spirochaetaceae bacterium]|nr:cytochrome P450 [Myxococcales bacterium]MCB9722731.1 cytochrome P450 [Spirochaetaceae bacterium]